jgi:ribA/ribD-fused uncharacterized protein
MSNFEQLKVPIKDKFGNEYYNSEGYYMAQRTNNLEDKKKIAANSKLGGQSSRNARKQFTLDQNENNRLQYMINAVRAKFQNNPELAEMLKATGNKEIIEKNYWKDDLFGVREDTLKGANILGKVLMQVRNELKVKLVPEIILPNPNIQEEPEIIEGNPMEFTFKSGYKLYLPFALNNEQRKALLKLEEFMNSGNKEITLSGYAGTGKTTLISLFDKYLSSQHRFPYYTAPTHRANAVTKLNNPNARVLTLHKLFGLSPDIRLDELGNYDIRDLEFAQKNKVKIQRGDLLIIDESSMVSDSLYDFIQKKIQELNIKVIYVGDKGQIKPVGQKNISKVFSANQNPQIQLTKVERTGDNAILEESTNLRNGRDFTYVSNINDKGIGVQYMDSTKEANDIISAAFTSENFKKNKLFFRILSGTNQVVKEYNALVRRILFNTNEQLVEGDILMGYDNFDIDYNTGEPLIINSGDYEVLSAKKSNKQIGSINESYSGYQVVLKNTLNSEDGNKYVFIVDINEDPTKVLKFVQKVESMNKEGAIAMRSGNRKKAAQMFAGARELQSQLAFMKDLKNQTGNYIVKKTLDYGYAHTIHKSQGGTYNKVLLLADTIDAFKDLELRQQLKYVGMSRATNNVFVLSSNNTSDLDDFIDYESIPQEVPNELRDITQEEYDQIPNCVTI